MNKRIRALQAQKTAAIDAMRTQLDAAAKDDRDLSTEESSAYEANKARVDSINKQIEREQSLATAEQDRAQSFDDVRVEVDGPNEGKDPKRGFKSFGEFARSVFTAGVSRGHTVDDRLRIGASAPSTFGNEAVGADGGFLVPPDFSSQIFSYSLEQDALLPMTDSYDIAGNSMIFPKDETTPWGTDGIRAYWQGEGSSTNPTKPKVGTAMLRLKKLMALVPLSDELVQDAPALDQYLTKKVGDSIRWKTNEAIINGAGGDIPLGAFKGAAAVVQAKDSGQAANTLTTQNIANMVSRLMPGSFGKAVWLIGPDVLPYLFTLTLGNYPIYLPVGNGGIKESPYGTLMGRPIMVSQHSSAFSSQGDVMLLDLSFYRTIKKAGGVQSATSMHLYFDADATAFRTVFRMDGQPSIAAPVSQAKGTNTLSPFVQLGAR